MIKRGKVLRDLTLGPGLLMIEGQQYRFFREDWTSQARPRPGLVVDVEFDARDKVHSITVVPEAQLAREQAEAQRLREGITIQRVLARLGWSRLAVAALLAAAWVLLTAFSIQVPFPGKLEFTLWQMLALLNARNVPQLLDGSGDPGAGLYGVMAVVALAGPFVHSFWKDPRALLGGLLPLGFMVGVGLTVRSNLHSASVNGGSYAAPARSISLGLGAYVSIFVGLLFVFWSVRGWATARASTGRKLGSLHRKAA